MNRESLWLFWSRGPLIEKNWGDALNPTLVAFLSGKSVRHVDELPRGAEDDVYSVIGSHLASASANWVVWGTGLARASIAPKTGPRKLCAVRGPLSRQALLAQGIDCPEVFGDPAIFYPSLYAAPRIHTHEIGIIHHIREVGEIPLPVSRGSTDYKFIDIGGSLTHVVDDIVSCRRIVSSSLHGIIAAHAYGVPATWAKFSRLPKTDGFKFRDYWASVGVSDAEAVEVAPESTIEDLAALHPPAIKAIDIERLLDSCPFMTDQRKDEVRRLMRANCHMDDLSAC